MKEKDKKQSGFSIGTSLVLVTFVLLCLVTFATLAYVQARSDLKLSKEATERTKIYYEADTVAQEKLAAINNKLIELRADAFFDDEYYENVKQAVSDEDISVAMDMDGAIIRYSVPVDESSYIHVELRVNDLSDDKVCTVIEWKLTHEIPDTTWEEEPLQLLF